MDCGPQRWSGALQACQPARLEPHAHCSPMHNRRLTLARSPGLPPGGRSVLAAPAPAAPRMCASAVSTIGDAARRIRRKGDGYTRRCVSKPGPARQQTAALGGKARGEQTSSLDCAGMAPEAGEDPANPPLETDAPTGTRSTSNHEMDRMTSYAEVSLRSTACLTPRLA